MIEDLRADLSHILTGLLHQRELEACVAGVRIKKEQEQKDEGRSTFPEQA